MTFVRKGLMNGPNCIFNINSCSVYNRREIAHACIRHFALNSGVCGFRFAEDT